MAALGQAQVAAISEWPLYPTLEGWEGEVKKDYVNRYSMNDIIE